MFTSRSKHRDTLDKRTESACAVRFIFFARQYSWLLVTLVVKIIRSSGQRASPTLPFLVTRTKSPDDGANCGKTLRVCEVTTLEQSNHLHLQSDSLRRVDDRLSALRSSLLMKWQSRNIEPNMLPMPQYRGWSGETSRLRSLLLSP